MSRQSPAFGLQSSSTEPVIVSPFDESNTNSAPTATSDGPLELTWDNVEKVLDEMRPFLIQDGGNVAIKEIDGPVVKLELQVRYYMSEPLCLNSCVL
jgi:hypothetical protein